ncbi:hypothetical protein TRFO_33049 [Tritrichomonas foetus]|uniref:Uncharacterized protein n=1 Tax=Tritrichomonas foetus TaxID=1144522 RepID=A0A1J4JRY0_9EUKA|nr:hypothetical protein TRFO_33049 [Tritrichomonas foetus]|eukprot:OHT00268.1 hypothetical protein TRFO_33049 [Tritrichomonas foetus]
MRNLLNFLCSRGKSFRKMCEDENLITCDPPSFDFETIPISDRPISKSAIITNSSNKFIVLKFGEISSDSVWFLHTDKTTDCQKNSGFDIFYYAERLNDVTISPMESVSISCAVIPSKLGQGTLPLKLPLPIHILEIDQSINDEHEDSEKDELNTSKKDNNKIEKNHSFERIHSSEKIHSCEKNIFIHAKVSTLHFKVSPKILFLDDCTVGTPQVTKFSIKNSSKLPISIIIYPPPFIQIQTPKYPNFVKIQPYQKVQLSLTHTPSEVGQFDHKILFDCIESKDPDTIVHFMTSVSPVDVPPLFPTISFDDQVSGSVLDFGEVHSGKLIEKSITLTNNSDVSYELMIAGIIDIFSPIISKFGSNSSSFNNNKENSFKSYVLKEQLKVGSSKELCFKTLLSAQYDSKLQITLQAHSSVNIFVGYAPSFNLSASSDTFDRRKFMITLVYNGTETYYRHIKCRALVCNSQINIEPTVIDFGDTIVSSTNKTGTVQISNISPLKATIKIKSSMKSLVIAPNQIEVPAKSTINYNFSFYPRKVNPDYSGTITFSNVDNPNNEVRLTVKAVVVATQSESKHSLSYSISSNGHQINGIDFSYVPQNYPAARTMILKNRTKEPLVIQFTSSSPDELFLYYDDHVDSNPAISESVSSTSFEQSAFSQDILLTQDSPLIGINELAEYTKQSAQFYESQFVMTKKYRDYQIVDHFEALLNQLKEKIDSLQNIENSEIEIPSLTQMEIIVVLIPKGDKTFIWKRRQLDFSITLKEITDVSRSFPILFTTCESLSFLSSHSLNFGTLQANTHCEYSLNLINESSLPLLFRLKSDSPVNFDEKSYGIVCPFSAKNIPFSLTPKIDGKFKSSIVINNILNINEERVVNLKGRVVRRSNFVIDPQEIDFGEVTAGTSSPKFLIFVTNTLSVENEFTFSNVQKENVITNVRPLISYQFKDTKTRLLTEKVKLQIEKLSCKLRCLERKKKWAYAEQIKKVIDELSETAVESTSLQIKQLGAKYMDRVVYKADPLQLHCIEVQLIPTILSKKPLKVAEDIDGMIMIYEHGRVDTQKIVKYKARVVPQTRLHLLDSVVGTGLTIELNSLQIDHIYVQEMGRMSLKIQNNEKTEENFWILSNSSDNAIITSQTNEGSLKPGESLEIPIDVFCLKPGLITKTITVTSQTFWKEIPVTINAEYRPVLQLSTTQIDFGQIYLTSLQAIEKRTALTITNASDTVLFVVISHNMPFLSIYENDPEEPQFRPLRVEVQSSIKINVLLEPQLEIEMYRKYKTLVLDSFIEVKAYDIAEEAENSLNESTVSPYFRSTIPILGRIGRIGLRPSEKIIDFGNLIGQDSAEKKVILKNRSSKLSYDVVASPTQGIIVEPSTFSMKGHQEVELTIKLQPSAWGINEGFIRFAAHLPQQYTKKVRVTSFVDPKIIEVDINKDNRNISKYVLGNVFLHPSGIPVPKKLSLNIRNVSRYPVTVLINEISKKYTIRQKGETSIGFTFPFKNPASSQITTTSNHVVFNPANNTHAYITNRTNNIINNNANINLSDNSNNGLFEPSTFSYKLELVSAATKKVIKQIEITGEFIISVGSLMKEVVDLGRFGNYNDWKIDSSTDTVNIKNMSNIDLIMNVSSQKPYFRFPKQIGPIQPNSEYVFKIEPYIAKMKELEGPQSNIIVFSNQNNMENKLKLTVNYDVRDSFLQIDRAIKVNDNEFLLTLNRFMEVVVNPEENDNESDEVSTSLVASAWFAITNLLQTEIQVSVEIEELIENNVHVEIYQRKTEINLTSFGLHPNDAFEMRVKAIKLKRKWKCEPETVLAKLHFQTEESPGFTVIVMYLPKE